MQNWYKNVFVDATVPFQLAFMQIWTVCQTVNNVKRDSNWSSSPPKYVSVLNELPNKLTVYENP